MPLKNSKRNTKGGDESSDDGEGVSSPKRKRFSSEERDRKFDAGMLVSALPNFIK